MKEALTFWMWFTLLVVSTFYRLDQPLLRAEEPRRAVVSLEMAESDQRMAPTILGKPYLNKPFLFNATQALAFKWFGASEVSARLPSTFAFLLTAVLLVLIGRELGNRNVGLLSSILYISFGDLLFYGSINAGELDLFFTFWLTLFLLGWISYVRSEKQWGIWVAIIGLTAAFFTKGIPALAFGVLSILAVTDLKRQLLGVGLVAFFTLLIVAGYFYIYDGLGNSAALLDKLIWETGEKAEIKNWYSIGLFTVIPALLKLTLPYILVLLFVKSSKDHIIPKWFWLWLGLNALPYLLSGTIKDRYLYILLPLIAWALAWYWYHGTARFGSNQRYKWVYTGLVVLLVIAVLIQFSPEIMGLFLLVTCLFCFVIISYTISDNASTIQVALFISAGLFCLKSAYKETVLVRTEPAGVSYYYKTEVFQMSRIAKGRQVVYFDNSIKRTGSLPWLNLDFEVIQAPLIPYQIPWEWRKRTGQLLLHQSNVDSYTGYILLPEEQIEQIPNFAEVHRFRDRWLNRDLILVLKPK